MGTLNNISALGPGQQQTYGSTDRNDEYVDHSAVTDSRAIGKEVNNTTVDSEAGSRDLALPDADAQRGVQKIEAVTAAWSKWSLAALLFKYVLCTYLASTLSNAQL